MASDDPETETTEDLVEGTRQARAEAEKVVEEAHEDAQELEQQLEDQGLTPDDTPG